jgi:hypothetical protein
MGDIFANVDLDMGGIVGAGLLSVFRVTFGDDGRFMWIEPDPVMMQGMAPPGAAPAPSGSGATAPPPMTPDAPAKPAPPAPGGGKKP